MAKKLLLVMAIVAACKPGSPGAPGSASQCDSRVDERQRWFTTRHDEYNDRSAGDFFRVIGNCSDTIVDNRFSCDKADVRRVIGDSPYLHDAQALGFNTYVCELASDHDNRITYSLSDVLTERARDEGPVAKPTRSDTQERRMVKEAIARLEAFAEDMCRCKAGDKACAEKVEADMKVYMDSMKGKEPNPKSVTEEEKHKLVDMMTEMAKCQQAAMTP